MDIQQVEQLETELLKAYAETYGTGGSPFVTFRQFLLQTPRVKERGRAIVAANRFPSIGTLNTPGKGAGEVPGSNSPKQQAPQQTPNQQTPNLPPSQQLPDPSGEVVAGDNFFDVLKDDVLKMSLTAVASKYTKEELTQYAQSVGAQVAETLNEKQIVKAISQALKDAK